MRRLAIVGAVVLLPLGACGDDDGNGSADSTSTTMTPGATTTSTPATSPSTSTTSTPAGACSASGLPPAIAPEPWAPAPVAAMQVDLAAAAATCDWDAIAQLADRGGGGVHVSFGDVGDPIEHWRRLEADGERPMRALRLLLGLPAATQPLDGGAVQYVWPRAHADADLTDEELQEIADTGLYALAELEEMRRGGTGYLGYRVLITATGDWTAFVGGD